MNNFYVDDKRPTKVYVGEQEVSAIYIDENKVWSKSNTIEVNPHVDDPGDITYDPIEELL